MSFIASTSERIKELERLKNANLARAKRLEKEIKQTSAKFDSSVGRLGWVATLNILAWHDEALRSEIVTEARAIASAHQADLITGLIETLFPKHEEQLQNSDQPLSEEASAGGGGATASAEAACAPSSSSEPILQPGVERQMFAGEKTWSAAPRRVGVLHPPAPGNRHSEAAESYSLNLREE